MSESTCPVRLTVPADPAFARPVRMLAANLAVLAGLTLDAVEDARMAAEEGFVWSCSTKPAACDLGFTVSEGSLGMEFGLGSAEPAADDETQAYAELILSAVCDEFVCDREAGVLRLTKRTDALDV